MHITTSAHPTKPAIIYEAVIRAATKRIARACIFLNYCTKNIACKYQAKTMFHVKHQSEAQMSCKKRADKRVVARQLSKLSPPQASVFSKTKL